MSLLSLAYFMLDSDVELILDSQPMAASYLVPSPEPSSELSPKPAIPSLQTFPLPPLDQQYDTAE
jgi:hypothetical protein